MTKICTTDSGVCAACGRPTKPSLIRKCLGLSKGSPEAPTDALACGYRGPALRQVDCQLCGRKGQKEPVYRCSLHKECTLRKYKFNQPERTCLVCPDRSMAPVCKLKWAYGVTAVPQRLRDLVPKTLASLAAAGFDKPRLFIDGDITFAEPAWLRNYEQTRRNPRIRAFGNWLLSAQELFIRHPTADRYAIFQDDVEACLGLREYLDKSPYPASGGYLNLITYPDNWELKDKTGHCVRPDQGWYVSNQHGRGAQGLVFDRDTLMKLLASIKMVERPLSATRGHCAIDGGIVSAMRAIGVKEYVHSPSLIGHTGLVSIIGNKPQPAITAFPGEQFDARTLL